MRVQDLASTLQEMTGRMAGRINRFNISLEQRDILYDATESNTTSSTAASPSLLDNLNHIRYRIARLESRGPATQQIGNLDQHYHAMGEGPGGTPNGVNTVFTLRHAPAPAESLMLFRNGILQRQSESADFVLSDKTITFNSVSVPAAADRLLAHYVYI